MLRYLLGMLLVWGCVLFCVGCSQKAGQTGGIIALTPSLAEAVWAMESENEHLLKATSPFTTDARADGMVRIQNVGALETIVSMRPELVLLHPSDAQLGDKLAAMGIPVMSHAMDTVADTESVMKELGQRLHREEAAARTIRTMHDELDANARRYFRDKKDRILIVVDRLDARMQQLYVARKPAFLADLVEGCGFDVIASGEDSWSRIGAEKLIESDPESILFLARSPEDARDVEKSFRETYSGLTAVRKDRFYVYDDPDITVPGPGMGKRQAKLCAFLEKHNR